MQLECARALHETLLVPVLMYGSEKMIWKEKEKSLELDRVPNARIRELYGVTKEVDESIDEGVLRWFGHVKRMEKDRIAKRVMYECAGSRSLGRPRKR